MYRRILVPIENAYDQDQALRHARDLAQATGSEVLLAWLVPVVQSEEHFFKQVQVEAGSSGARRKEEGERFLRGAAEVFHRAGVRAETQVVVTVQPPEQAVADLVEEEQIDLIILATLPRTAVGRFLFGSLGDKVRRRSPVPVLFVNPVASTPGGGWSDG